MPRRSAASLSLVVPAGPVPLAPVPADLSPTEAAMWREVVESKPSDWFGADSWPVLKEYVRAATMCDTLAKALSRAVKSKNTDAIKAALDMRDKESRRMTSLATKLRLTQQSQYGPRAAATAAAQVSGPRPWQSAG